MNHIKLYKMNVTI